MKLFVDYLSQPSRAVLITLSMLNVPFEVELINIMKGEHKTEDFARINKSQQVPAILDGDFNLCESHTIMKYIIRSRNIQTQLFPLNDVKQQARIEQYLDYHHTGTRKCTYYLRAALRAKMGQQIDPEPLFQDMLVQLAFIDKNFLQGQKFICGNELTIADISAYCEFDGLEILLNFDFSPYSNIKRWMDEMKQISEVQVYNKLFIQSIQALLKSKTGQ